MNPPRVAEAPQEQEVEPGHSLTSGQRLSVTFGVMMGLFLAAIEQTVVATAMPTVVASLGGLNIYSWVFSAYLLTFTITVPIWGRLSDIYGRRRLYLISIGLFILGSALAGQARTMTFLILSRALQGLGGGGVFPIGFTIVGDIYSIEQRARIQGLFSGVWGVASIVGPLAGGLITDLLSWRWVFYVNVPFGLAAAALIGTYLTEPEHHDDKRPSIDIGGALSLAGSITLLLLGLIQAGKRGSMVETDLLALFAASIVLFILFLRNERRTKEPLLPVSLFRNRVFRVCSVVGLLAGMGLFGSISFIPLFVQGVIFGSATRAGSALTPLMLGWVILSIISGRLILSVGYRPLIIAGMAFFTTGFLLLSRLGVEATYSELLFPMAVLGIGMGLTMVPVLLAVQNTVPRKLLGTSTSAQLFFRTIGGSIGVAIMGSVMAHRMSNRLQGTDDPVLVDLAAHPDSIVNEGMRQALSPEAVSWLQSALADSLHGVFVTGILIAGTAILVALRFPSGGPRDLAEHHSVRE